jgi:hypothetical protein
MLLRLAEWQARIFSGRRLPLDETPILLGEGGRHAEATMGARKTILYPLGRTRSSQDAPTATRQHQ